MNEFLNKNSVKRYKIFRKNNYGKFVNNLQLNYAQDSFNNLNEFNAT